MAEDVVVKLAREVVLRAVEDKVDVELGNAGTTVESEVESKAVLKARVDVDEEVNADVSGARTGIADIVWSSSEPELGFSSLLSELGERKSSTVSSIRPRFRLHSTSHTSFPASPNLPGIPLHNVSVRSAVRA